MLFYYKIACISLVVLIAGIFGLVGLNSFFEYTNRTEFCISCHTMQTNYEEYKQTVHYKNAAGIQATCADCHVPKDLIPKFYSKIYAVKDIYHEILGTIDTREKFEARRWHMANVVWDKMRATDSRECRSCHEYTSMDISAQDRLAGRRHTRAAAEGETCIDCHTGIVHKEPLEPLEPLEHM